MDPNRGFAASGQSGHLTNHRDETRTVLVTADYHLKSGKYQTNQLRARDNIEHEASHPQLQPQSQSPGKQEPISDNCQLEESHCRRPPAALPVTRTSGTFGRSLQQLNSYLFCLNLFLSVLNTLLISLLVKSVQQSGHNLLSEDGRLAWDEHSESLHLDLPVRLRSDRLLSVGSIESDQDGPLIIENVHTFAGYDNGNEFGASPGSDARPPSESSPASTRGQILISARAEGSAVAEANFIRVPAGMSRMSSSPLSSSSSSMRSFNARSLKRPSRPVEIFANSLILNQLSDEKRLAVTPKESRNVLNKGQGYAVHETGAAPNTRGDQLKRQSAAQVNGRRLLELDGPRQTIVLPLLNKIDLFPSSGRTLFVKDELRCSGDISGRLDANLE